MSTQVYITLGHFFFYPTPKTFVPPPFISYVLKFLFHSPPFLSMFTPPISPDTHLVLLLFVLLLLVQMASFNMLLLSFFFGGGAHTLTFMISAASAAYCLVCVEMERRGGRVHVDLLDLFTLFQLIIYWSNFLHLKFHANMNPKCL